VPQADGGNLSEERNGSNDKHVLVTSLKDRKQRASETVSGAAAVSTCTQQSAVSCLVFYSACAVTFVAFGHYNRPFYLLTYLSCDAIIYAVTLISIILCLIGLLVFFRTKSLFQ